MKNLVYLIILTLILLGINSKAFAQSDSIQVNIDGDSIGMSEVVYFLPSDGINNENYPITDTFYIQPFIDPISLTISEESIQSYGFGNYAGYGAADEIIINKEEFIDDTLIVNIMIGFSDYQPHMFDNRGLTRFMLVIDNSLSVVENEISVSNALVYPNPVMNNLSVEFETINYDTQIEVYSVNGQLMYVDRDNRSFGFNKVSIDMSDYPTGMYMVRIGNLVKKIVK